MRWLLKRWWIWGGTGFVLVAIVADYLVIPVSEDRLSQANCDRIQLGMSKEQVSEVCEARIVGEKYPCGRKSYRGLQASCL